MRPFENDIEAVTIGELSIENGSDQVVLHGQLIINKDLASLEQIEKLEALLSRIKNVLTASASQLPEHADGEIEKGKVDEVDNPFNT